MTMLSCRNNKSLMAFFFMLTGYLAAALSLITGAFLGLAILASPGEYSDRTATGRNS